MDTNKGIILHAVGEKFCVHYVIYIYMHGYMRRLNGGPLLIVLPCRRVKGIFTFSQLVS